MNQSSTAASYNAFLHCCLCCRQCILHTQLLFLHFCFCCRTNLDYSYAAGKLCQSFLIFFLIKCGICFFHALFDLCDTRFDGSLVTRTVCDDGCFLFHTNCFRGTQHIQGCILQGNANLLGDNLTACQCRDICQLCFSSFTVAGCLYRNAGEYITQLVHNQSCQNLAFYVLCNQKQLSACLHYLLQNRQDFLNIGNFLICNQNQRLLQNRYHLIHIRRHVCGKIPSVELHPFYQSQLCFHGLGFLNGDNAVICNLIHCFRNHLADFLIPCGDCRYVCNVLACGNGLAHSLDFCNSCFRCLLHPASENNRVCACRNILQTLLNHCLCQNGRCCSTVAGNIICLCRNLFYQLCAHVFIGVFQLDILCNGNAVVCNQGRSEFSVQNHVSALGPQCYLYCICQLIHTCRHCVSGIGAVFDFFCHNAFLQSNF